MIDKETDNYELYYALKVIRNTTSPEDKFILGIKRVQEPQVRFYLRREAFFMKIVSWAKGYIESKNFSYFLVENTDRYKPLIKYLLHKYKGYKYYRYFLFNLEKPGEGLRVFRRKKEKTTFLYKYFVSPFHKPGKYQEIKDKKTIENVFLQFKEIPDLYPFS
jgi:hypothetical protein